MAIKINGTTVIDDSRNFTALQDAATTSLTYGGVSITPTPQEINYLDGVTSDVQTQLDVSVGELATLDKTFVNGEQVSLALSSPLSGGSVPFVGVTKEVPQVGVTNNEWDVASDGANYTLHDTAYSTTLTPSDASADGTFTLGTGSFAAEDVGKRIEGNGGVAFLTATDGSYIIETSFNDTSTIAAGDWSMFALDVGSAAAGLALSSASVIPDPISQVGSPNSLDVSNVDIYAAGIFFKPDGSKLLFCGRYNDRIYEFDFATPFDITSASYTGVSLDITPVDSNPYDVVFKPDGLRMIVIGGGNNKIYQYDLSTAWDISTASYSGVSFSLVRADGSGITSPSGLYIRSDGLKMYTSFQQDPHGFIEHDLSVPWDISTASVVSFFATPTPYGAPYNIHLSDDGTRLYYPDLAYQNSKINEYVFSVPWDITTISPTSGFIDIENSPAQNPQESFLVSEVNKMYTTTTSAPQSIYEFTVSGGGESSFYFPTSANHTAITSTSTNTEFWVDINSMTADDASNDGSVFYAVSTDDRTTWKIIDDTNGVRNIVRNNNGTWEVNDASDYGTETWVAASENDEFYALEEAVDIDTAQVAEGDYNLEIAATTGKSYDVNNETGSASGHWFSIDGTKMFVLGQFPSIVYQYSLSSAYDLSTVSYDNISIDVSSEDDDVSGLAFNDLGSKMYIVGSTNDLIFQYSLSTNYDISTASYDNVSFNPVSQTNEPYDVRFNSDGTKMYIVGNEIDSLHQYSLSIAFDISSASYDSISLSVSTQESNPRSFWFSDDGTLLFVVGVNSGVVYQYDLSTAFDLSTASYANVQYDLSSDSINSPTSITFSPDGKSFFIYDAGIEFVTEFLAGSATSTNRMDATQLNAVSDANHYTLGDDLDLAITLTMPDSGSTSPTSDGVSINYDAQVKNEGAIVNTDYEVDFPASDTVRFKALSDENFKIRVL